MCWLTRGRGPRITRGTASALLRKASAMARIASRAVFDSEMLSCSAGPAMHCGEGNGQRTVAIL